jgi:predicted AlkP superfamily pyrophosphatase or phosphodiesterase
VSAPGARGHPARWLAAASVAALPLFVLAQVGLHVVGREGGAPRVLVREFGSTPPRAATAYRVVLVSIDGLSPEVLEAARAPVIARLSREGLSAARAETVEPPTTLPAHTSMLSGLPVAAHGVRWNRYYPWLRIDADTLFTLCRRDGLRCGLFVAKDKLAHLAEHEPGVERFGLEGKPARVFDLAASYLAGRDPDLTVVHLGDVDGIGHVKGWGSPEQLEAVERIDTALGDFLERVRGVGSGRLALIVTADHGGSGNDHGGDPSDYRIPWIVWGEGIAAGRIEEPVSILDTAPTVLALLGRDPPASWTGHARVARSAPRRRRPHA